MIQKCSLGRSLSLALLLALASTPSLAQSCSPVPAGIVSWWAGDGNGSDEQAANPGTLLNSVGFAAGKVDQAFSLAGTAHVRVPDNPSLHLTTLSVEAWVYPTSLGAYHEILSKWNAVGSGMASYDFAVHPDGRAYLLLSSDGSSATAFAITTNSLPLNSWSFLVGTYDGTNINIYVNGQFNNTFLYSGGVFPGPGDLGIGGTVGGEPSGQVGSPFAGKLDEVCLYNRALSALEIQQIYAAGVLGKCKTLIPPSITTSPVDQTLHVGMFGVFQVVAAGRPKLYQWQLNHSDIPNATNDTLVLGNVQTGQAGTYSVVVSNSAGVAPSSDASLTVLPGCVSAPPGMTAWWPGEGDTSDHFDGNTGTAQGGLAYAPGESGQCFSFDGTNGMVSIPASSGVDVGSGTGLTVECWLKPSSLSRSQTIVEWNSGSGNIGLHLDHSDSGIGGLGAVFADLVDINGASHVITSSPGLLTTATFQHVALTYDHTTGLARIYRNGSLVTSQNIGAIQPQTTYPLVIGARPSGPSSGQFFQGLMDEIALYNRALSDAEILAIFSAGTNAKACIVPQLTLQPLSQRVRAGTNVTFTVSALGSAPLYYQWRLGGNPVAGATNTSLIRSNVQPSVAGDYSVSVTNFMGSVTTSNANLKIDVLFAFGNGQALTNSQANFSSQVTIQLQSVYTNGDVFYTLDGSEPSFFSQFYAGPFIVTHDVVLRALGYSADFYEAGELDPIAISIVPTYSLSATSGGGGTVSLSPSGGVYLSNTTVTATAVPASGWSFLQWLGDSPGSTVTNAIRMTGNKRIQAVFGTTVNTTAAGPGSVSLNPPGLLYPYGTIVSVSAIPQLANFFVLWGNSASGNANPLVLSVTNPTPTISSLFSAVPAGQVSLAVVPVGGGRVSVSPRTNLYNPGASVTLTATADSGQKFLNWSGDASGNQNPFPVSLNQNKTIYANFTRGALLSVKAPYEGMRPEGFVLTLAGDFGARYEIDVSTNFTKWAALTNLTNLYGSSQVLDPNATNSPRRFYRAVTLP